MTKDTRLRALVAVVALAALPQCAHDTHKKWGMVTLRPADSGCAHLAGPPRISAYRGDRITWRIYNECARETTVRIHDLRFAPPSYRPASETRNWEEARKAERARAQHEPLDPLAEPESARVKRVPAREFGDLTLTVREDARRGLYTYLVMLGDKPDMDQEIDIRPPKR